MEEGIEEEIDIYVCSECGADLRDGGIHEEDCITQ